MADCRHGIRFEGLDDAYMCDLGEGHEGEEHICKDLGFPVRHSDEEGGTVHLVQEPIGLEIRWIWPTTTTPTE